MPNFLYQVHVQVLYTKVHEKKNVLRATYLTLKLTIILILWWQAILWPSLVHFKNVYKIENSSKASPKLALRKDEGEQLMFYSWWMHWH